MSHKPSVRYHSTVYFEVNQNIIVSNVSEYVVKHVIQVMNGSIESVLHLIGYSLEQIKQINRQLAISYIPEQKVEFELSYLQNEIPIGIMNDRPSRAHIVQYKNRLYGVLVDKGMARICGQICKIIPQSKNDPVFRRGIEISRKSSDGQCLSSEREVCKHIESGQHLVVVSENGALFVVPNGDDCGHQFDNRLTLILDHGFVIINESIETPVLWIRTKQHLKEEKRESNQLTKNESIIAAFAAISICANDIKIYGTGSVVNIGNIKQFYDCI